MTKLILADLDRDFLSADGEINASRLSKQLMNLAKQNLHLGFMTEAPYAKMIQIFHGIKAPLAFICEGGAETVLNRVVRDETVIDYEIWKSALKWFQAQRDFNTAYIVLSGKMNAYTDASKDSSAYQRFNKTYPSLYQMNDLELVSDLVYQIRLGFENGDMQSLAQTFNSNFNGKLVAHAKGNDLWITSFDASYQNAIETLSDELDIDPRDVALIDQKQSHAPVDELFETATTENGYDAIDQFLK